MLITSVKYKNICFIIGLLLFTDNLQRNGFTTATLEMEKLMKQCPECPGITISTDINYCRRRKKPLCCCQPKKFDKISQKVVTVQANVNDKEGVTRLTIDFKAQVNSDGVLVASVPERYLKKYVLLCQAYGSPAVTVEVNLTRLMSDRFGWIGRNEFKHIFKWTISNGLPEAPIAKYVRYEQMMVWMYLLEKMEFVKLYSIGKSSEGQPIVGMVLLKGDSEKPEGSIFIESGIHSREGLSPAALIYAVNKILLDQLQPLFKSYEIHVALMVNPDGYAKTSFGNEEFDECEGWPRERFWRKNTRQLNDTCTGVDLNRNFDAKFKEGFNRFQPCTEDNYGGLEPFSEPETRAIRDHILALLKAKNLRAYVAFHNNGQFVLYPYSFTTDENEEPKNIQDLKRVAQEVANAMSFAGNTTYSAGTVPALITSVPVFGGSIDWAHLAGVPYSFAIELRPNKNSPTACTRFYPQPTNIPIAGEEVYSGIVALLKSM